MQDELESIREKVVMACFEVAQRS